MDGKEEFILIGYVRRRRGNRGEVTVESMSPDRSRFSGLKRVFVGPSADDLVNLAVERVWFHGKKTVMKLASIDSIGDADAVRGQGLYVPVTEAVELPRDSYFQHDLVGLEVEDVRRGHLGRVRAIIETGGTDLIEVRGEGPEILIPAAKAYCVKVDLERRVLAVDLPEEMLDRDEI